MHMIKLSPDVALQTWSVLLMIEITKPSVNVFSAKRTGTNPMDLGTMVIFAFLCFSPAQHRCFGVGGHRKPAF